MVFRGRLNTWAMRAALLALLLGCSSEPLDACSNVGVAREPFTRKCLQQSFDPVIDEANPSYGRVACQILSAFEAGSEACACDTPGFAAVSAAQRALASSQLSHPESCELACCADYCFCELLQHSGDALAACQSRPSEGTYEGPPSGWCYLEPALGLGTEADVADCPSSSKRLIRYFPDDPRYQITAVLSCLSDP